MYASDNRNRQYKMATDLMRHMNIEEAEMLRPNYGLEYIENIEKTYDSLYPNRYRVVIFSEDSGLKPIYKGKNRKAEKIIALARKPLLWHKKN